MAERRGAGDGSIYQEKSGLWAASVEVPTLNGQRRRKVVRAKTRPAVATKLRELRTTVATGDVASTSQTTGQWVEFWFDNVLPGTVKPSTEQSYREAMARVLPHIENIKLAKLGPEHVQAMMRALEDKGLSPRSIAYSRAVLRRSLTHAVRWGKIQRNVAALVDAPRQAAAKIDDALSAEEAQSVLNKARGNNDRLYALVVLVLMVGLRQAELLHLRWTEINLKTATLTVSDAKTEAGKATIALPTMAVAALTAHQRRQKVERMAAPAWDDPGLVFPTKLGRTMNKRELVRWWHKLTRQAGVGRRRFHATRHTAATLMLNNGVPLEVVSATLRHSGYAITADIYAKVRPNLQRGAADAMDQVFSPQTRS